MDIEVRRCLTALTSINYTSPIGLDCTSFTNKLLLQDEGDKIPKKKYIYIYTYIYTHTHTLMIKAWEIKIFNKIYYGKYKGNFFILTSK